MYIPKFTINTDILRNVGLVEAAKEVIVNAPMVPAWEAKFREDAQLRAAHYGTVLEGNDLTMGEAKMIMDNNLESTEEAVKKGLVAKERDVQEVINYRKVLKYIEEEVPPGDYTEEILCQIHKLVVDRVVAPESAGKYREKQVILRNSVTGEVGFRPPAATEVPDLIKNFMVWLNAEAGKREHPVIRAGIVHYVLAAVHPFIEGNGRTARAMATLVLFREGYDVKKFFALEEYFDKQADEYYGALMEVSNQSTILDERDLTPWLTVFTKALALELTRIKEQIRNLSVDMNIKKFSQYRQKLVYVT